MIIMTMAQHETIEHRRVDAEEVDVVDQRLGREAEIDEKIPCLRSPSGFDVHREAELADQGSARRFVAADAPAEMLDVNALDLAARGNGELIAVDHNPYRKRINLWDRPGDRLGAYWSGVAKQRRNHRAEDGSPATTDGTAPVHKRLLLLVGVHDCHLARARWFGAKRCSGRLITADSQARPVLRRSAAS